MIHVKKILLKLKIIFFYLDEILEDYGYLGVYLYLQMIKNFSIHFKTRPENFIYTILEEFYKNFSREDLDSLKNSKLIVDIIKNNMPILKKLIETQIYMKKELIILKIVFDIAIFYFTNKDQIGNKEFFDKMLLPTATLFYTTLTQEELIFMYDRICGLKNVRQFLSNKILYYLCAF
jgi:hypothetical protein